MFLLQGCPRVINPTYSIKSCSAGVKSRFTEFAVEDCFHALIGSSLCPPEVGNDLRSLQSPSPWFST